jgi:hypothetical protein
VLLHDEVVVEQPLACRSQVDGCARLRREPGLDVFQDPLRTVQARQQGCSPGSASPWGELLFLCDGAGALGQVVSPEQLTADRPGEKVGLQARRA